MLHAYAPTPTGLTPLAPGADLQQAVWVDLYRPLPEQEAAVAALGVAVPSLADMEEIEISNRLFHEGDTAFMTAVLPGQLPDGHHAPRPFETFPQRADKTSTGCGSVDRLFLGLLEDIIARLADLLEQAGRVMDQTTAQIFDGTGANRADALQSALQNVGRQADLMARVRLGLLTVERVLSFYSTGAEKRAEQGKLRPVVKAHMRDIQALEVHLDFLSARVGLAVDATLGMISLQQNNTVRILSVVAALFLPPTLIASAYGMNFEVMPELHWAWGYPLALGMMVVSAVATFWFIKWKKWL